MKKKILKGLDLSCRIELSIVDSDGCRMRAFYIFRSMKFAIRAFEALRKKARKLERLSETGRKARAERAT